MRTSQMTREEPLRRPLAEPAQRCKPRLHVLVRQLREGIEIDRVTREPDDVLGLAAREAEREQLVLRCCSEPLARRERPRLPDLRAERSISRLRIASARRATPAAR
jgi:hypothetical protein